MIVAAIVLFFIGVVAVSTIVVILAVKLLDKGLDALDALLAMSQRNSPFKKALTKSGIKNQFRQKNNAKTDEESSRYLTGCPPIKHMASILYRLRRRVNQSGKEPTRSYD